jgi:pyruvate/2-oxoglutarate dehydrogenase complex dihydrolipoamide dehydrogenase (E3) component
MAQYNIFQLRPEDSYNGVLLSNVHPPEWENPPASGRYNLVVIGAGTAGLVAAAGAAALGAKVALVERYLLGGDCLNVGCVPSKAIIRSSRAVQDVRLAQHFGIRISGKITVDFPQVMERMRKLRSQISFHDSVKRFHDLGVDVFLGEASFSGKDSLQVGEQTLRFNKAVLATGARAVNPPVEGLIEAGYFTNETVFSLTRLPRRLAVIGGGPLGCELAQSFRRLGSEVVLFQRADQLLGREDDDAAGILQETFLREGIRLLLKSTPKRVVIKGKEKFIAFDNDGKENSIEVDEILIGAGRAPNVEGLGLDTAGVQFQTGRGVIVNDYLQTTNPRIYAAGDVCLQYKFTHMADATARIALQNALFAGRKKLSALTIPWVTYTDPEIAHVGMSEREANNTGMRVDTFVRSFRDVDRAVLDGEIEGFVKIHVQHGSDRILGATIVARHAGEMISEIGLAMTSRLGLKAISNVIHPYPTQAEAIKQVGDIYNRGRLTPLIAKILSCWLKIGRSDAFQAIERYRHHAKMTILSLLHNS